MSEENDRIERSLDDSRARSLSERMFENYQRIRDNSESPIVRAWPSAFEPPTAEMDPSTTYVCAGCGDEVSDEDVCGTIDRPTRRQGAIASVTRGYVCSSDCFDDALSNLFKSPTPSPEDIPAGAEMKRTPRDDSDE